MPPTILQAKPEDLDTVGKRSKYNAAIIGCGRQGILTACQFAEAGFRVTCVDSDQTKVNVISNGKAPFLNSETSKKLREYTKAEKILATSDLQTTISHTDIIALTIPAKTDGKKKIDYNNIKNACKQIGTHLRRGSMVIILSVIGIGAAEAEIKETLENSSDLKTGIDFGVAYSPMLATKASLWSDTNIESFVAAFDKNSLSATSIILEKVFKTHMRKVENLKTVEAAALFEATRRNVNQALTNELAVFCERTGLDYMDTAALLQTEIAQIPMMPTLPDSNLTMEARLLLENAENASTKLRISALAEEVNDETIKHAINLTKDALANCGKTLKRAKISLLGATEGSNTKSPSKTILKLAEMLEARGAKIRLYDPYLSEDDLGNEHVTYKKGFTEALEGVDCVMITTNHEQFKKMNLKKMKLLMKMPAAIVDLNFAIETGKIEKEGFIYRGLGRGVWKK